MCADGVPPGVFGRWKGRLLATLSFLPSTTIPPDPRLSAMCIPLPSSLYSTSSSHPPIAVVVQLGAEGSESVEFELPLDASWGSFSSSLQDRGKPAKAGTNGHESDYKVIMGLMF